MIEVKGRFNTAKVFTDSLDDLSKSQIETLCNQPFTADSVIRLMPDVHAGAGCTIGTTMTISDKIIPNMVGVDIGCGMETLVIPAGDPSAQNFDPVKLDEQIHEKIPCGREIRNNDHEYVKHIPLNEIRCPAVNVSRANKSVGTLGGGNHFIEANRDDDNKLYIVIHSGSRHLGKEIAEWYQEEAWNQLNHKRKVDIEEVIKRLKAEGRQREIQERIKEVRSQVLVQVPEDLAYVSGDLFENYINDMKIAQVFAVMNRKAMMQVILEGLGIENVEGYEQFTTIHNYIDTESMILRKGAVSAKAGEKLLIPMNMRDGSLVCEGLGNMDWNCSAPHGAGRLMSRSKAFKVLSMDEFKKQMEGIYSTTVKEETLDESPMAYKNMDEIIRNLGPTAKILKIIKPVYNFKAAE